MNSPPRFLASYFTLAGQVHPFSPPLVSPVSFKERAEAAGKAGFEGFGFHADDLVHILKTYSFADISKILDDNGLKHIELELLNGWFSTNEERNIFLTQGQFILDAAAKLGARHIKVGTSGPECSNGYMAECFADLCDRAAQAKTAIALEISQLGRISDLASACKIIIGADRKNGGILLDIWHVSRSQIPLPDIAKLPQNCIAFVELNDGSIKPDGGYLEETINQRLPCGAGEFALADFINAVVTAGYEGPYGIEILSDANRALSVHEAATIAFSGAVNCFDRHDQPIEATN